jgi:hypothetical protein
MGGNLFVRLLLFGHLLAVVACANSDRVEPKSTQSHADQQILMNGGNGGGGGGGY